MRTNPLKCVVQRYRVLRTVRQFDHADQPYYYHAGLRSTQKRVLST